MKTLINLSLITLVFLCFFSCDEKVAPPQKTYNYLKYNPPKVLYPNDSILIDLNNDNFNDVIIKSFLFIDLPDTILKNTISIIDTSFKLSYGQRYSSYFEFILNGDRVNPQNVHWSQEIPISGYINSVSTGIWNDNNNEDKYLAILKCDNELVKMGWLMLSCTDSSITLKEFYMNNISNSQIIIGTK